MSDGSDPYGHALRAIQTLKGWGAVAVSVGGVSATFGVSALSTLPELPVAADETPEERAKREEREFYGSAG